VSHYFSRAAYNSFGRTPDSGNKPTTLSESGDRSPKGFGYVNTGSKNGNIIEQGGADANKFFQQGTDSNQGQAKEAYAGFMNFRKTQHIDTKLERGRAEENRANRGQAKMRLKGEVF
jgi:hypothetical protein